MNQWLGKEAFFFKCSIRFLSIQAISSRFGWWWWWWFDLWSVRQRQKLLKPKHIGKQCAHQVSKQLLLAVCLFPFQRACKKQSNLFSCYYPICKSHLFVRIIYGYLYLILLIVFGLFLRTVYVLEEKTAKKCACTTSYVHAFKHKYTLWLHSVRGMQKKNKITLASQLDQTW